MKKIVDRIIKDLKERPNDFTIDEYLLKDKKNGVDFWIRNGYSYVGIGKSHRQTPNEVWRGRKFMIAVNKFKKDKITKEKDKLVLEISEKLGI